MKLAGPLPCGTGLGLPDDGGIGGLPCPGLDWKPCVACVGGTLTLGVLDRLPGWIGTKPLCGLPGDTLC